MSSEKVIVSCRVRLARNYHDLPFSTLDAPDNAALCIERAKAGLSGNGHEFTLHQMNEMLQTERQKLVEKHLISRDLIKHAMVGAALIRDDRQLSVMINEEDIFAQHNTKHHP